MPVTNLSHAIQQRIAAESSEIADRYAQQIGSIENLPVEVQLSSINQFWRMQIGALPQDTVSVRLCLEDAQTDRPGFDLTKHIRYWLENFTQFVIPVIVNNNLPAEPKQ